MRLRGAGAAALASILPAADRDAAEGRLDYA